MLILSLTYTAPLEQVDRHIEPHLAWVKQGYDRGWFIASGRKNPRTGGLILSKGARAEVEAFCATDPFVTENVAVYDIIEADLTTTAQGYEVLKG